MNKNIISLLVIILVIAGGVGLYRLNKKAGVDSVVSSMKSDSLGEYLTDSKGMTLYTYSLDKKLWSTCVGSCLTDWPPFLDDGKDLTAYTDALSKGIRSMKRSDGTLQYAYIDSPLYYYTGDTAKGDTKGNNLPGVWSIVPLAK